MSAARRIALLALVPALALAGCGNQKQKSDPAATPAKSEGMGGMDHHGGGTPAENADMITCPVSGHSVAREKSMVMTYEGKEIRLCCADCVDPFKADPAKYMAILEKNEKATH